MSRKSPAASLPIAVLQREARAMLLQRADPEYLEFIVASIGVRERVIGVRVPAIRAAVREFHAAHAGALLADAVGLMDVAAQRRVRDEMLFATFWLCRFRRRFEAALWPRVNAWIEALDNWETCDQLAGNVAAELVGREIQRVADLLRWTRARNPWRLASRVPTGTARI